MLETKNDVKDLLVGCLGLVLLLIGFEVFAMCILGPKEALSATLGTVITFAIFGGAILVGALILRAFERLFR